jgi:putative ABC transport system permease protein
MKWLRFAVRNVLRNRRRSLITVLIAAVGTASILIGGGFAQYTYQSLREAAARESGHLVLAHKDFFSKDEDAPLEHGLADYAALESELTASPAVRAALPRLQFSGLLSNGDRSAVFIGSGVDAGGEFRVRGPFLTVLAGSTLSPRPAAGDVPEIMVGKELARQLRAEPGSSLTLLSTSVEGSLNAQDVRVKGIFSVGVPEMDKRIVMVHLATAQKLLLTEKASTLSVYLFDTDGTDAMQAQLARAHPEKATQTWLDQAFYYLAVRGLYDRIFGLMGTIIVALVLFAVANTLGMAVVERTREIGTLRAMGASPALIVRNFALEGLVVGAAGAFIGMVGAALVSVAVDFSGLRMPPPPGWSIGYPLHIDLSLPLYGATAVVVVLASVLAAWSVSRSAADKAIVEALSHV